MRALFLDTILGVCGAKDVEHLPQSVKDVLKIEDFDGKGHLLTARRIKAVTKAVQEHLGLTEAAGAYVSGSSPAVAKLQHMVMTAPCIPANATNPADKMAAFGDKLRENAAKEIVTTIPDIIGKSLITNGKIDFNKVHEQFKKDISRDMRIYIGKTGAGKKGDIDGLEKGNDEEGGGMFFMDGATSYCRVGLDINLSSDRLQSVADGDWSQFDYKAFDEAGRGKDGSIDKKIAQIPENLRIDAEVTSASAHFDLNAGENPLDKALEDAKKAREQAGGMKA